MQPAAAEPNRVQKKKLWEEVQPDLKTDASKVRRGCCCSQCTTSTALPCASAASYPRWLRCCCDRPCGCWGWLGSGGEPWVRPAAPQVANYRGHVMNTSAGPITAATLTGASIS
jgi:hypothetical protein